MGVIASLAADEPERFADLCEGRFLSVPAEAFRARFNAVPTTMDSLEGDAIHARPEDVVLVRLPADADTPAHALRIGRAEENELVLSSPSVSARHLELWVQGDQLLARDLGTKNGSRADGQSLGTDARALPHGAVLEIGSIRIEFVEGRRLQEWLFTPPADPS